MIDKNMFDSMRAEFEQFDKAREEAIKTSRDVLKASKAAIYAVHRNEAGVAVERLGDARAALAVINTLILRTPKLSSVGAINEGREEFAEASCYYSIVFQKQLPSPHELGVPTETYVSGICDVVGELVRKAIKAAIDDDAATAMELRAVVHSLFEELSQFEWRNAMVRRKFDSIKYGVEKLDDLALQLKRRGTHG